MAYSSILRTSGVYKITCIANGKIYVGSAVDLRKRWIQHKIDLRGQYHANSFLQRAFNKYGETDFIFEILELVIPLSLLDREQYWLDELNSYDRAVGFNLAINATSPMKGRKATPETRAKMSAAHKGIKIPSEQIAKIAASNRGQKRTPETCANISAAGKGRKMSLEAIAKSATSRTGLKRSLEANKKTGDALRGKPKSDEHRKNLSISKKGKPGHKPSLESLIKMSANSYRSQDYIVTTPEGEEFFIHGLNQLCKENGLNHGHMSAVVRGERKHHKGWKARLVKLNG